MTDLVNGLFELFGGILLCLNIRRLYKDKKVTGVSWIPVAFFTSWGLWNLYFYPALNCWASFVGGIVVVTANAAWLGMAWWYCWWRPRHHPIVGQKVEDLVEHAQEILAKYQGVVKKLKETRNG